MHKSEITNKAKTAEKMSKVTAREVLTVNDPIPFPLQVLTNGKQL